MGKKDGFINGVNNISALVGDYKDRMVFTSCVDDVILQQYVVQSYVVYMEVWARHC